MATDKKSQKDKQKELLSLREYAKWCGTSHQTIRTAIDENKIVEGFDKQTQKIRKTVADLEWGIEFTQRQAIKRIKNAEKTGDDELDGFIEMPVEDITKVSPEIPITTSMKEVIRLKLVHEARTARLKAEEAAGRLVDKSKMYKEMYDFGGEIKSALQNIPDRIIDRLINMERNEAHKFLKVEIDRVLEKLATDE